jgi:DNA-binding response OmpR family regulator
MTTVLLVDDEPQIRRIMRVALEKGGFSVDTAENGEVALAKIRANGPDVVITDIEMPRMDGRALCAAIEKEFVSRAFPIFVLTSLTAREHRDWSAGIANLSFLEKPVSVRKLISRLQEYFGGDTAARKEIS